jgi:hypothetical protein
MLAVSDVEHELAQEGLTVLPAQYPIAPVEVVTRHENWNRTKPVLQVVQVEEFIILEHRLLSRTPLGIVWARTLAFIIRHASF